MLRLMNQYSMKSISFSCSFISLVHYISFKYLGSTPKSVLEPNYSQKKSTKKHLYPLELRVPPNNTARYTDALSFYQGFIGFTRTNHSFYRENRRSNFY